MDLSIVIPAHNEEKFIDTCIKSINDSCNHFQINPEIIIVLNRCTDRTKDIVDKLGVISFDENSRNLAKIRNAGIRNAKSDVIITIDADSIMTKEYISDLIKNISRKKYVGGGTVVDFNRKSLGIKITKMTLDLYVKISGLACGSFWFYREYFDKINGFDENLHFGEDIDFSKRLRNYGRSINLKYGISGKIITSTRKFDKFGDWYFFKLIMFKQKTIKDSISGKDMTFVNDYFYDFNKNEKG